MKDMGEGVYPLSKHLIVVSSLKDDVIYSKSQKLRVTQGAKMGCRPQTLRNCVCFISHPKHSTFQKGILRAGEGSCYTAGNQGSACHFYSIVTKTLHLS